MSVRLSEKLTQIVKNTALMKSAVPIILCNSQLVVCAKSIGASNLVHSPKVGASVKDMLDKDIIKLLSAPDTEYTAARLHLKSELSAIITKGTVAGEKYYAIIGEPRIWFCPVKYSRITDAVCRELGKAVEMLLGNAPDRTEDMGGTWLLRFYDYFDSVSAAEDEADVCDMPISDALMLICELAKPYVESVGGFIETDFNDTEMVVPDCSPEKFYALISSLLVAAIFVSKEKCVTVSYEQRQDSAELLDIVLRCACDDALSEPIGSYLEFAERVLALAPELAAILAMANEMHSELSCVSDGTTLALKFAVPMKPGRSASMASPLRDIPVRLLKDILGALFAISERYFRCK